MSRRKGFCRTHDNLCWIYDDGNVQCMYDLIVETHSHDHDWVADPIDALCARHGITVEGIVALVDEVMKSRPTPSPSNLSEAIEDCWGNSDDLYYAGWEVGFHDAMLSAWRLARREEA